MAVLTPTINIIQSGTEANPVITISSDHVGKRVLIVIMQDFTSLTQPTAAIFSTNNSYEVISQEITPLPFISINRNSNTTIVSKIADGNDDTTMTCPILNPIGGGVSYFVYVISDSNGVMNMNSLRFDGTPILSPSLTSNGRDSVFLTIYTGLNGTNLQIGELVGYLPETRAQLNGGGFTTIGSWNTALLPSIDQASYYNSVNKGVNYTFGFEIQPTKIIIGVPNNKKLSIDGNITKNNLIINN